MTNAFYDNFYSKGGWEYDYNHQTEFLKTKIIEPLNITKGKLLEIGCGMGMQAQIFSDFGLGVTAIDYSEIAIKKAKERYKKPKFICNDLAKEEFKEKFDYIYSRAISWYHYQLNGVNKNGVDVPKETKRLFKFLRKGGLFILQINTDFSGGKNHDNTHMNKLEEYTKLFSRFGKIMYISDWKGNIIKDEKDTIGKNNIIIATRRTK